VATRETSPREVPRFRHCHASALLDVGAPIKAVSQGLGHSTVELTLRVYFHVLPDAGDSLAGMTDKLISQRVNSIR